MAILRNHSIKLLLLAGLLLAAPASALEIPHLLNGFDLTGSSSAAGGSIYTLGAASAIHLGSSEDPSNNAAETHFNYTSAVSPANPEDPNSPLKHSDNWAGGAKINLWNGGSLGIDLDGLYDNFEGVSTNGQKITIGVDPFRVSYRFARSTVFSPIVLGKTNVSGALIYQNTFEFDYDWRIDDSSTISFDGSYAIFNPPAPNFGSLLSAAGLVTFSSFQDTLQSFEEWRVGGIWQKIWTDRYDTSLSAHLSHEIIPANPLIDIHVTVGFQTSSSLHVQVGWEYSHDPTQALNTGDLEVRWSWDRKASTLQSQASDESLAPSF